MLDTAVFAGSIGDEESCMAGQGCIGECILSGAAVTISCISQGMRSLLPTRDTVGVLYEKWSCSLSGRRGASQPVSWKGVAESITCFYAHNAFHSFFTATHHHIDHTHPAESEVAADMIVMADAGGSSTPVRSQQASRSRTTTNESHSTPSRISRLFSFGNGNTSAGPSKSEDAAYANGSARMHRSTSSSSAASGSLAGDADATISLQERPSTPTPPARRGSQTGRHSVTNGSATSSPPQRRNSRTSFLFARTQSLNAAATAGPSEGQSGGGKGEDLATPQRPGTVPRSSNDASSTSWRLPWTSPKKKTVLPAADILQAEQQAHSFGSVGLTMNGDVEETEVSSLPSAEGNTPTGDVLDEGISMSDTSGKVGR